MVEIEEERLGFGMTSFKNLISFTFIKEKKESEGKKGISYGMQNKNQNIYIIIDAKKYKIKIYMQKSKTQKIKTHKTCEPSPTNFYKN